MFSTTIKSLRDVCKNNLGIGTCNHVCHVMQGGVSMVKVDLSKFYL